MEILLDWCAKWCYDDTMKKPNTVKNTRKTSLRMPEELAQRVERLATADSRSFN